MPPMSVRGAIDVTGAAVQNHFLVAAVIIMGHRRLTMGRITPVTLTLSSAQTANLMTGAHFNYLITT